MVIDGPLALGQPKALELYVREHIADLSVYGIGKTTNGGGSAGLQWRFPAAPAAAGSYIYVAQRAAPFQQFFGFAPTAVFGSLSINGNDAVELFHDNALVDVFGDVQQDGVGTVWEYTDGWAYRRNKTGPSPVFAPSDWQFSGKNALDGSTSNRPGDRVPIKTYIP